MMCQFFCFSKVFGVKGSFFKKPLAGLGAEPHNKKEHPRVFFFI
jgi:hypothetical protein